MIVYNISIKIDPSIETEWVRWQLKEHIPEVLQSGEFIEHRFYRLLGEEDGEPTFVVQYFAETIDHYQRYEKDHAAALRRKALEKWGNRFIAFRTLMETVN